MVKVEKLEKYNLDISSCNCCSAKNYISTIEGMKHLPAEDIYKIKFISDTNNHSMSVTLCMTHLVELIKEVDNCFK